MYVDGFLVPVPKKNLAAYLKFAKGFGKIFIGHGALAYHECVADDVKKGKLTSFPRAVKMKGTETVFFSWAVYKNRAHRDRVVAKVMNDQRLGAMEAGDWPFDGMRMIYGGFKSVVNL